MNHAIESQLEAAHKSTPKKIRLLTALVDGPKNSFQLEKHPTYDHCPNSTVSELRKAGVEILTEMVSVPGYGGEPARIARYSLTPKSRDRALQMIGGAQ
jgi:hypothetical protein